MYNILCIVHYALYIKHYTLYIVHYTLCTLHIVHNIHYTLCTLNYTYLIILRYTFKPESPVLRDSSSRNLHEVNLVDFNISIHTNLTYMRLISWISISVSISITLRGSPFNLTHLPLIEGGVGMSARGSLKVHSYRAPVSVPSCGKEESLVQFRSLEIWAYLTVLA